MDTLPQRGLEPVEPGTRVVNPVWRAVRKELWSLRNKVAHRCRKLAGLSQDKPHEAHELEFEIGVLDAEIDGLERRTDEQVLAGELPSEQRLEALPQAMCLLLDTVCMIAYRAEAALANVIAPAPCCGRCSPVAPRTSRSSRHWHASTKPRPPFPTRISGSSTSYCPTWNSLPPAETASRPPNLFHTVSARCKEF